MSSTVGESLPISVNFDPDFYDRIEAMRHDALERFDAVDWTPLSGEAGVDRSFLIRGTPDNPNTPCIVKTIKREWYTHNNATTLTAKLCQTAEVLTDLAAAPAPAPVEVPRILWLDTSLPYIAYTFIEGDVLTGQEIRASFSRSEQLALGHKLGELIHYCSQIEVSGSNEKSATSDIFIRNEVQFYEALRGFEEQKMQRDYPAMYRALGNIADDYQVFKENGLQERYHFGHGDLHAPNLVFNQHQLIGVIDWEDAGLTNAALEAAPIMTLSRHVGRAALEMFLLKQQGLKRGDQCYFGRDVLAIEDAAFAWTLVRTMRKCTFRLLLHALDATDPGHLRRLTLIQAASELEQAYYLQNA